MCFYLMLLEETSRGQKYHIPYCHACLQLIRNLIYRISSDIRQIFSFQNNPKDLDPSYKMDLDL